MQSYKTQLHKCDKLLNLKQMTRGVMHSMLRVQAFDKGPWPRMTGRQRGLLMNKLADLMQVKRPSLKHGRQQR